MIYREKDSINCCCNRTIKIERDGKETSCQVISFFGVMGVSKARSMVPILELVWVMRRRTKSNQREEVNSTKEMVKSYTFVTSCFVLLTDTYFGGLEH